MQCLKRVLITAACMSILYMAQATDAPKPDEKKPSAPAADAAKPAEKAVQVVKAALGTGINKDTRELAGEAGEFNASAGRVYCWSKIQAKDLPAKVKHIWYKDGQNVAEVTLSVASSPFRTWSSKAIEAGKWKVEIVDANGGGTLATVEFNVKE